MTLADHIKNSKLFAGLDKQEINELSSVIVLRNFKKGEVIFFEGDEASGFYALFQGKVRVYKANPDGKEYTLHIIYPGQLFAEVAIFDGRYFPANSMAIEDSVVGFFSKLGFISLIEKHPKISLKIIGSLARFLREYNVMVEDLALKEVPSRIARYLLDQAARRSGATITLDVSKAELARSLGTISETLSRNLRKLKDMAIIKVDRQKITILDLERLSAIAEGKKI